MLVKVKIEIDIEPNDKISRIKERRLIYSGKQMADEMTASQYGIEGGSVLHLVLALRGGQ
ncbi:hypothetical protein V8B55DRAFT_1459207 [Mucor lusitanicus]